MKIVKLGRVLAISILIQDTIRVDDEYHSTPYVWRKLGGIFKGKLCNVREGKAVGKLQGYR